MPQPTLTERLKLHIKYTAQRDKWARRALDLLAQGKDTAGRAAAAKAQYWDVKVLGLEPNSQGRKNNPIKILTYRK